MGDGGHRFHRRRTKSPQWTARELRTSRRRWHHGSQCICTQRRRKGRKGEREEGREESDGEWCVCVCMYGRFDNAMVSQFPHTHPHTHTHMHAPVLSLCKVVLGQVGTAVSVIAFAQHTNHQPPSSNHNHLTTNLQPSQIHSLPHTRSGSRCRPSRRSSCAAAPPPR